MILQKTILALLLSLQPNNEDLSENISDRIQRLTIISEAITQASQEVICSGNETTDQKQYCWTGTVNELAMTLLAKGWSETRFSKRIHNGQCRNNECDPVFATFTNKNTGKKYEYVAYWRAKSNWQIHKQKFISTVEWSQIGFATLYSTYLGAKAAAKILAFGKNRCGGWSNENSIERAMALYATGKTCKWSGTKNRIWLYQNLMKKSQDENLLLGILLKNNILIELEDVQHRFVDGTQLVQPFNN